MKPRTALIAAVMALSLVAGAWLLLSACVDRMAALYKQKELLESIEAGNGEIAVDEAITGFNTDYYDDGLNAPNPIPEMSDIIPLYVSEDSPFLEPAAQTPDALTAAPDKPLLTPEAPSFSAEPVFTETPVPIADTEFPESVIGIGILTVEKLGLRLPVAEGVSEAGLKIAAGHVPGTANAGETGNAVIAGHRSYAYGKFFNRLDELVIGDVIGYQAKSGEAMSFEVFETAVIHPGDQIAFVQPSDESIITLYTCTPVRVATHRLIVRAKKICQ